jgi:C4-type Zn-finger protein
MDDIDREIQRAEGVLEDARTVRRRQMQPKLKCPADDCDCYTSHVVRCRIAVDGSVMHRRRQCDQCGARFNTTERVDKSA